MNIARSPTLGAEIQTSRSTQRQLLTQQCDFTIPVEVLQTPQTQPGLHIKMPAGVRNTQTHQQCTQMLLTSPLTKYTNMTDLCRIAMPVFKKTRFL